MEFFLRCITELKHYFKVLHSPIIQSKEGTDSHGIMQQMNMYKDIEGYN